MRRLRNGQQGTCHARKILLLYQVRGKIMKRTAGILIALIAVIALVVLAAVYLQATQKPAVQKLEPVVIGVPMMLDSSALVYVADDRGFFSGNGLNATIMVYDAGLYAVDDLLKDKNDFAVATEFVMVDKALKQEKISSVATIAKYQIHYLIGRRDRGIEDYSGLRGKKIGFARDTSGEFYLNRCLALHGVNMTEVTPVDVKPSQYVEAIENGSVDAVLAWDPHVDTIKDRLGTNAVVWPAQSGQLGYWNAIVSSDWATQHPETIVRFLKSIDRAAEYSIYHPAEAKAIVQKRTNYNGTYIETTWRNTQFSLSLDESLITAMEDEGRWMINNNLTSIKKVPDFRDYIYTDGLRDVKPDSVNIII